MKLELKHIKGCAHIDLVINQDQLKNSGFLITPDVKKIHITFKSKK